MKKILSFYIVLLIAITALLSYQGCADLQKDVTGPDYVSAVHPTGWLDTTSANFHGRAVMGANWTTSGCKLCHGIDYRGGAANASCYKCHTNANGPEACNTCHGDPLDVNSPYPPKSLGWSYDENDPHVGAHFHHLNADYASDDQEKYRPVACMECHRPVNNFSDTNHINPVRNGSAGIFFGPLAKDSTGWGGLNPNPSYNPSTSLCSNVYCHGDFFGGNVNFKPQFNNPNSVKCGSCHGDSTTGNPTPGAPGPYIYQHLATYWTPPTNLCFHCHTQTIDSLGNIIGPQFHIDGIVEHIEPGNNVKGIINNNSSQSYIRQKRKN